MSYLVDGNNVMGQRVGWHRDRAGARRRLLSELARFVRLTAETVTVVFDGPPDDGLPDGALVDGVRVHCAGPGSDADTRIVRLVESVPDRRGLVVVTSDRRLADDVRHAGAQVERSGAFRRRLDALVAADETQAPPAG